MHLCHTLLAALSGLPLLLPLFPVPHANIPFYCAKASLSMCLLSNLVCLVLLSLLWRSHLR